MVESKRTDGDQRSVIVHMQSMLTNRERRPGDDCVRSNVHRDGVRRTRACHTANEDMASAVKQA